MSAARERAEKLLREIRRQAHDIGWANHWGHALRSGGRSVVDAFEQSRGGAEVFMPEDDELLALLDSEPEPDARYVVDHGPLGDAFQAEIAAKLLLGELPRESIDCEGLGGHMRSLARRLRATPTEEQERRAPESEEGEENG